MTGKNNYGRADYLVHVEPEPKFLESGRALVGRTLVKGNYKVPLRLMNVTDDVQKIYRGTLIGKMTAVEENLNLTTFAEQSIGKLRSDLKDLLDRSKSNRLPEQVSKVEDFLRRNHYLFAASNYDLGQTNVVRDKINTEQAKQPIKQAPSRIPIHLTQEVDAQRM